MNEKVFCYLAGVFLIAGLTGCGPSMAGTQASEPSRSPEPNRIEAIPITSTTVAVHVVTLESGISMRVLWTISSYIIGKRATWSEQDAKAMLFKPLDMTDTEIIFDSQACKDVSFQPQTVKTTDYLSNVWQTTSQSLGIVDQEMQVFKTTCSLPGFQEYMRLADGRLIVPINGVFFFFEPAVSR
jgi:hypothetical protein